jgi:hypothetical protein
VESGLIVALLFWFNELWSLIFLSSPKSNMSFSSIKALGFFAKFESYFISSVFDSSKLIELILFNDYIWFCAPIIMIFESYYFESFSEGFCVDSTPNAYSAFDFKSFLYLLRAGFLWSGGCPYWSIPFFS